MVHLKLFLIYKLDIHDFFFKTCIFSIGGMTCGYLPTETMDEIDG